MKEKKPGSRFQSQSKQDPAPNYDEMNEFQILFLSEVIRIVREEMLAYRRTANHKIDKRVVLRTAGSIEFVAESDIIRCEAEGRYTRVYFGNDEFLFVSMHLKELERTLSTEVFIRCHNSHLINKGKIRRYNKSDGGFFELINGDHVPLARARKDHVLKILGGSLSR